MNIPPTRSVSPAFTLIELVVTLTIIAVAAAVIIPELRGTRDDALLRVGGRRLISASALAYSQAIVRNETHRIAYNPSTGKFAIERQPRSGRSGNAAPFSPATELPEGGRGEIDTRVRVEIRPVDTGEEAGSVPEQARSMGGPPALVFHADGTAEAAEVQLRDAAGFRLTFRLNPVTARLVPVIMDSP